MSRRPQPDLSIEFELVEQGYRLIAGIDEAGRGALAGPVVAAAVILPLDQPDLPSQLDGVNDSKLLSSSQRTHLRQLVAEVAAATGVGSASAAEIDETGIAPATRLAMTRAVEALALDAEALIIDYMVLPHVMLFQRTLPKADQKSLSVAAASILAKVERDLIMEQLAAIFSGYGFAQHKGYGTAAHQEALKQLGPCPEHRHTFAPIRQRLMEIPDHADRAGT